MKNFKKIMGVILVLCLVITQFPVIGGKRVKAAETGTKTDVTSSKISFDYEKAKQEEAKKFTFYGTDVAGFHGNGDYEIQHDEWMFNNTEKGNGYTMIGSFESDTAYTLNNIKLIINDTYEFLLNNTKDSELNEDGTMYKLDCPHTFYIPNEQEPVCETEDKSAALKYTNADNSDDKLISLYVSGIKTDIKSSKITFTYEKFNPGEATEFKFINEDVIGFDFNDGNYEIENAGELKDSGYQNIGYFTSDATYTLKNVVLTVNSTYEFVLKDAVQASKNNKGKYEVAFFNMWSGKKEGEVLYTSKDGKATLVSVGDNLPIYLEVLSGDNQPGDGDGDNQPGGDGDSQPGGDGKPQEPGKVKTEITSSKLSFTYENTGEGEAKALKVCGAELSGFNGNGTYEADVAEKEWETWDKTGYYNLGFIESDTAYTLKNVILIVNDTKEFVLGETFNSEEKEGVFKVDFPNIWGDAKEGDILYTSKDKKATLVSGGNNVVISLFVSDDKGDDSDNTGSGDDIQKPGGDDTQKPGDGDTQKPDRVQVDIKSSKLSFTYEKTGETDATFLKVSGMDVNGFNGNGTYEIDILESAWNTWDKTGYYNLGFVSSDAAYTLKNVVVTVNGTYEFVLEEIKAASYKEDENLYKVDFINMWSGHKEGDVLYTSKDGKAALVSGGNTAVISLMVDKAAVPTPKPFLPPYAITPPTTAPVATTAPTAAPTTAPTVAPTTAPVPTTAPTSVPTVNPTTVPTVTPVATVAPTKEPVTAPSSKPEEPSDKPGGANDIQKGDKVTVSGQKYEVTNNSKKTVAYVAAKGSKKASVSVPATVKVKVDGKKVTYKVTSIKDKAFKGNKKIKTITVSKNITSIGKDAFKNCGKLKTIVIKSTNITKVGKDALKGTAKNLVIKVPANKVSAYKKLFKNKGNNSIIIKKA